MINKITYGNITEGSGIGVMAFKIKIDNQIFPKDQIGKVMKVILSHSNKRKVVEINGNFAPILNEQMLTLIMTLKDNNFHTQVNAPGDQYYPWFSLIDRLVIHIDNLKIWPTFKCEDFIIYLSPKGKLIEPEIPKYPNVVLYLNPYWHLEEDKILTFMEKTKNNWRIYPKALNVYIEDIWKFKEQEEGRLVYGTIN